RQPHLPVHEEDLALLVRQAVELGHGEQVEAVLGGFAGTHPGLISACKSPRGNQQLEPVHDARALSNSHTSTSVLTVSARKPLCQVSCLTVLPSFVKVFVAVAGCR